MNTAGKILSAVTSLFVIRIADIFSMLKQYDDKAIWTLCMVGGLVKPSRSLWEKWLSPTGSW